MGSPHRSWKLDTSSMDLPPSPSLLYFYSQLPLKQRKFVDELIVCQSVVDAARRAGYDNERSGYRNLMADPKVRCAIRERMDTVTELASISAADVRRELRLIQSADATELAGVWRVPCRHCHGLNHQYQYTHAEFYFLEQVYSYGETGWPYACVTSEFGSIISRHAQAAYIAGKQHRVLDIKGGDGYSRNKEINEDCPQCHGQGEPMVYICDTRKLSEGGKKLFKGVKLSGEKAELLTINRQSVLEMLARDTQVGIERKEISINMPRTPEELEGAIRNMNDTELGQFVANMIDLNESDYSVMEGQGLPKPNGKVKMRRGN